MIDLYYILDENMQPVAMQCETPETLKAWGQFCEENKRVKQDTLEDGTWISTVFLGIDHRFGADGLDPILWETMIFSDNSFVSESLYQRRYISHADAVHGHDKIVQMMQDPFGRNQLLNSLSD